MIHWFSIPSNQGIGWAEIILEKKIFLLDAWNFMS